MEVIKFFVNPMFRKDEFVDMLNDTMHVAAGAVDDGIILDREAFNAIKAAYMPHWAWLNKKFINSEFHTVPATERQLRDAQYPEIKMVGVYALNAFGGWEFGQDGANMFYRSAHSEYCGEWERIEDYDIDDDGCSIIYHLRGGFDISQADILRV